MKSKRKICVVTGSRAEYGLLKILLSKIEESNDLLLKLVVTGSHLSKEFGETIDEIRLDGLKVNYELDILNDSKLNFEVSPSIAKVFAKFPTIIREIEPDLIIVLGDRYEIFACVASALFLKIPVAHIHGGEVSEGAFDESLRHAITKMSHIHFTSSLVHKKRVEQLGEDPEKVFNVGAPGVEAIQSINLLSKKELENTLDIRFAKKNLLITLHPETLEDNISPENQINNLLNALESTNNISLVFTMANADPGGEIINQKIQAFVADHPERSYLFPSLGQRKYLSVLNNSFAIVGNTSSGLIEAPSLNKPFLNIGNRQKGRMVGGNIINCKNSEESIKLGLEKLFKEDFKYYPNPFDGGNTSTRILDIIRSIDLASLTSKKFYDL